MNPAFFPIPQPEKIGDGCFREYDQIHIVFFPIDAVVGDLPGFKDDGIVVGLAPFVRLVNVRLNNGDLGSFFRVGNIEGRGFWLGENAGTVSPQQSKKDERNGEQNFFSGGKGRRYRKVARNNQGGITENADEGKRLQKRQLIAKSVAQVTPWKTEVADAAGHFESSVKEREQD